MLSLVVIEYHSLEDICIFANSVDRFIEGDYELIVSSNSLYSKEQQETLKRKLPSARCIFNAKNGGFAYGMNEGLKVAKGDILTVVNPDVRIQTSLAPMIDYLGANSKVGIIAPKIIDAEGIIQDSFRHFLTPWGFFCRQIGWIKENGKLKVKSYQEPVSSDWVIGAFMMCRRDFYKKVGGFSDDYFMYCEDMDWCKRAHLAGYDVVYYPETVIEYKGTRAARRSWKYTKIFLSSLFTYWKKYGIR